MSNTVLSILDMIRHLPPDDRVELVAEVERLTRNGRPTTSLRDLQPASIGRVMHPLSPNDDLLQEMGA